MKATQLFFLLLEQYHAFAWSAVKHNVMKCNIVQCSSVQFMSVCDYLIMTPGEAQQDITVPTLDYTTLHYTTLQGPHLSSHTPI